LDQKQYVERIVPAILQPCDYEQLSWTFRSYQLVHLSEDFEKGCRELSLIWGIGYSSVSPDD